MPNAKDTLLQVLRETRVLLALPDNDFAWSRWNNATEALSDFDGFVSDIEAARSFDGSKLSILFAPTGAVQEVSESSGWGEEFLRVAARFDSAFAQYESTGIA
jgi:hypothetical protein